MDNTKLSSPFVTVPEIFRFVASIFDTKNRDKTLDDACRRIDTNYRQIDLWILEIFEKPLKKHIGQENFDIQIAFFKSMIRGYLNYVGNVPLDGLDRRRASLSLINNFFGDWLADFVRHIHVKIGGPQPYALLDESRSSFDVLLEWLNSEYNWFDEFLKSHAKEEKDKLHNWRRGEELAFKSSVVSFFNSTKLGTLSDWQKIRTLALTARAIDALKRKDFGKRLVEVAEYRFYSPSDSNNLFDDANAWRKKICYRNRFFLEPVWAVLDQVHKKNKSEKDYIEIKKAIAVIEELKNSSNHNGEFNFWFYWAKGRHLISIGEFKKANALYKKAYPEILYKAGADQNSFIVEALSVAAVQGKTGDQSFLKTLKSMAVLLDISLPNMLASKNDTRFSAKDILDEYEVVCLKQRFVELFPDACLYTNKNAVTNPKFGFLSASINEENRKPNLNRVDENISIKASNGRTKKIPQLAFFAMFNKTHEVSSLLQAGADINKLSNDGESTLLFALTSHDKTAFPQPQMNDELLELVLRQHHSAKVINQTTLKLKLLPLICAVKTGKLSVVKYLLENGAEVDARGETDGQTALNVCIKLLMQEIDPEFCKRETLKQQNSEASIESLKRHCAGLFGATNEQVRRNLNNQMIDPINRKIQDLLFDLYTQNWGTRYDIDELRNIALLLLEHGADPNIEFTAPIDGYTPLMLVVENNDRVLFERMIEKGGDPDKSYYDKNRREQINCFDIARAFNSGEILHVLKTSSL